MNWRNPHLSRPPNSNPSANFQPNFRAPSAVNPARNRPSNQQTLHNFVRNPNITASHRPFGAVTPNAQIRANAPSNSFPHRPPPTQLNTGSYRPLGTPVRNSLPNSGFRQNGPQSNFGQAQGNRFVVPSQNFVVPNPPVQSSVVESAFDDAEDELFSSIDIPATLASQNPSVAAPVTISMKSDFLDDDDDLLLNALEEYEKTQRSQAQAQNFHPSSSISPSIQITSVNLPLRPQAPYVSNNLVRTAQFPAQPVATGGRPTYRPVCVPTTSSGSSNAANQFATSSRTPAVVNSWNPAGNLGVERKMPTGSVASTASTNAPLRMMDPPAAPLQILDELPSNTQVPANVDQLPGFEVQAGLSWIYPTNVEIRDYQFNISQKALYHNTLVSLPTGRGKTFIAAVVIYNFYRWYPKGKILFLVPTKSLVNQQDKACYDHMGIPQEDIIDMTGSNSPARRKQHWVTKRVLFMTPQIAVNDLDSGFYEAKDVVCVVVDEAHRATKNHHYCQIIQRIHQENKVFRVLALTATPGRNTAAIQQVITNLLISRCEFRDDDSIDIVKYNQKRKEMRYIVQPDDLQKDFMEQMKNITLRYLADLKKRNALFRNIEHDSGAFALNSLRGQYTATAPKNSPQTGSVIQLCLFIEALLRANEQLCCYGLRPFHDSIDNAINEDSKNKGFRLKLENDEPLRNMIGQLKEVLGLTETPGGVPYVYSHPKLQRLETIVVEHFNKPKPEIEVVCDDSEKEQKKESRIIVFTTMRSSVRDIVEVLSKHEPKVRPAEFIGQASKKGRTVMKGLKQSEQNEILDKFRSGEVNVIVSTSIGEEGLDIGEVDLIILFDTQANPTRDIQRIGRTGRNKEGKVAILIAAGMEEKKYEKCQQNKASVKKVLLASNQWQYYKEAPRMVPAQLHPVCVKMKLTLPEFDRKKSELYKQNSGKMRKQMSDTAKWLRNESESMTVKSKKGKAEKCKGYMTTAEWEEYYSAGLSISADENVRRPEYLFDPETFDEYAEQMRDGVPKKFPPPRASGLKLENGLLWQEIPQDTFGISRGARCSKFLKLMAVINEVKASDDPSECAKKYVMMYPQARKEGYIALDQYDIDPDEDGKLKPVPNDGDFSPTKKSKKKARLDKSVVEELCNEDKDVGRIKERQSSESPVKKKKTKAAETKAQKAKKGKKDQDCDLEVVGETEIQRKTSKKPNAKKVQNDENDSEDGDMKKAEVKPKRSKKSKAAAEKVQKDENASDNDDMETAEPDPAPSKSKKPKKPKKEAVAYKNQERKEDGPVDEYDFDPYQDAREVRARRNKRNSSPEIPVPKPSKKVKIDSKIRKGKPEKLVDSESDEEEIIDGSSWLTTVRDESEARCKDFEDEIVDCGTEIPKKVRGGLEITLFGGSSRNPSNCVRKSQQDEPDSELSVIPDSTCGGDDDEDDDSTMNDTVIIPETAKKDPITIPDVVSMTFNTAMRFIDQSEPESNSSVVPDTPLSQQERYAKAYGLNSKLLEGLPGKLNFDGGEERKLEKKQSASVPAVNGKPAKTLNGRLQRAFSESEPVEPRGYSTPICKKAHPLPRSPDVSPVPNRERTSQEPFSDDRKQEPDYVPCSWIEEEEDNEVIPASFAFETPADKAALAYQTVEGGKENKQKRNEGKQVVLLDSIVEELVAEGLDRPRNSKRRSSSAGGKSKRKKETSVVDISDSSGLEVKAKTPGKSNQDKTTSDGDLSELIVRRPRKKPIAAFITPTQPQREQDSEYSTSGLGDMDRSTSRSFERKRKTKNAVKVPPKRGYAALEFIEAEAEVSDDGVDVSRDEDESGMDRDATGLVDTSSVNDPSYMEAVYREHLLPTQGTPDLQKVIGMFGPRKIRNEDIFSQTFEQDADYGSDSFVAYSDEESPVPKKKQKKVTREKAPVAKKPTKTAPSPKARGKFKPPRKLEK